MSNIKVKFDAKKLNSNIEKSINKIIEEEKRKAKIKHLVNEWSDKMYILNETEKELLKIILESECDTDGCTYMGTIDAFPEYIKVQIKKLFAILEESGYAAKAYSWLSGGWQICITPEGQHYFENEQKYKEESKNSISIGTIHTGGGFVNFGVASNINYSIDNSYNELNELIDKNADEEDVEELKELLEELKEYLANIEKTQAISTNKSFFKRLGAHFTKYQWFYQSVVAIIGQSIVTIMSGNKNV